MKHRLYRYKENVLALGLLGLITLPLFFIYNKSHPWLSYLLLVGSLILIVLGLLNIFFVLKSEYEEKHNNINYIKVKNVKFEYIKTIPSARHPKREIIGYKFFYKGKSYIYISNRDLKLEKHISNIYAFEYYNTYKMIKSVKYN